MATWTTKAHNRPVLWLGLYKHTDKPTKTPHIYKDYCGGWTNRPPKNYESKPTTTSRPGLPIQKTKKDVDGLVTTHVVLYELQGQVVTLRVLYVSRALPFKFLKSEHERLHMV